MAFNLDHVIEQLQQDPKMAQLLSIVELRIPQKHEDVYFVLLKSIVEQQLSLKAAATIWKRFLDFMAHDTNPVKLINTSDQALRSIGLSYQKASYLHNIARFAQEEDLSYARLQLMNNEEVIKHLTKIKGVGKWTAEMILMFALGRMDVFPVDDLVIRNTMIEYYDVQAEKGQQRHQLEIIAQQWRPYRSFACYLLWDWKDQS